MKEGPSRLSKKGAEKGAIRKRDQRGEGHPKKVPDYRKCLNKFEDGAGSSKKGTSNGPSKKGNVWEPTKTTKRPSKRKGAWKETMKKGPFGRPEDVCAHLIVFCAFGPGRAWHIVCLCPVTIAK